MQGLKLDSYSVHSHLFREWLALLVPGQLKHRQDAYIVYCSIML